MAPKKAYILIVDDNTTNISSLERMLSKPDRGFASATNGKDALKIALSKDFDIILLDVQMPSMGGFEVAQILKTNRRTRGVPVIFVSDEKPERAPAAEEGEDGAIDYLYRPLDPAIAGAKVSALLQQRLQKKELSEKNAAIEKYDLLLANSPDLICTLDAGTLKFQKVNEAVTEVLGYSAEEVKGSSLLFYLHEEEKQKVQAFSKETGEKFSFETRIWGKNRVIKLLRWNITRRHGQWLAYARDVTGANAAEDIKNYLATVVKQSNEAIYLHNAGGKIISWNKGAEKIYGFTEREALQMNIWNIVPEHLMHEAQQVMNTVLGGAEVESVETKRITKQGRVIDVLFSASVFVDAGNKLHSIAITERDITKEKQANRELEKALAELKLVNRELESFSYSISHDLRSPLRALSGFSHILEEEFRESLNEEGRRLLGNIQNSARRMGMLIDDLLAFSRLGRTRLQKSPVDMGDLVSEVLRDLKVSMGLHDAVIKVKELPPTQADRALLRQVWTNLISNALKYSAKSSSPTITIGYMGDGREDEYVYYVQDNGVGFNMEYVGKLFGVFQRLHPDEEFEGTGVGLAIVQRIISRHGGKVWAKGEPGRGATFTFSLPRERKADGEISTK
ncbi:MAG TPA: PAS domain S-box protein [Puia sp.]